MRRNKVDSYKTKEDLLQLIEQVASLKYLSCEIQKTVAGLIDQSGDISGIVGKGGISSDILEQLNNIDTSSMEQLKQTIVSLGTVKQLNETLYLSDIVQKRIVQWKKWAHLHGKNQDTLTINNHGITIHLPTGDMKFGFQHIEEGHRFSPELKTPSQDQLKQLINFFGTHSQPYIDILGMKNTGKNYFDSKDEQYNAYWLSSFPKKTAQYHHDDMIAFCLDGDNVCLLSYNPSIPLSILDFQD